MYGIGKTWISTEPLPLPLIGELTAPRRRRTSTGGWLQRLVVIRTASVQRT